MAKRIIITIGDKVRKARELAKLTQFELAYKAGVRPDCVSRLELNKGNASLVSLHKIASALGVTIDSLLDKTPGPGKTTAGAKQPAAKGKNA